MKKSKILFSTIASTLAIGTVISTTVALTSCNNNQKGQFFEQVANPYKELNMFAETMKAAGYGNDQTNLVQKGLEVSKKVKQYIKAVADVVQDKLKNKSIVFLKNDILSFDNSQPDEIKMKSVNRFQMEQPILFPTIYGDNTSFNANNLESVPSLQMSFPAPNSTDALKLFDDSFEIGASELNSTSPNPEIPSKITIGWEGTSDFVVYLYDSKLMTKENEAALIQYINSKANDPKFLPNSLFKSNATYKKVIPLDIQYFYLTSFHVLGNQFLAEWLSSILLDALAGTYNGLDNYTLNPKISALASQKVPVSTVTTMAKKLLTTNRKPNIPTAKVNLFSGKDNVNGHLAALGIKPEIFTKNGKPETTKQYLNLGAFFFDTDPTSATGTQIFSVSDADSKVPDFIEGKSADIEAANIYAYGSDRSLFGQYGIWPLTTQPAPTTRNSIGNRVDGLLQEGTIGTCVYTERNDTKYTQSPYTLNILLADGTVQNLQAYAASNKNYVTLA